ncbi:MAG: hypothetical protein L6R38_009397, partial [Xanthoria sp. 2 TBL-2021]
MEAAASIITVITLSLQSTKFIYQSTKEIRDGPSVVTELAARTRRLEETLQQLQHLVQDSSQLTRVHDTSIWEPLVRHTSQCSDTLQEMARKFKALDSSGSKDRLKKTWKGIKISLKKEDLSRSSDQMQHHIDVLGLQIGIINSRLGISREARESQLLDTIQASLRDTNAQLSLQTIEHKTHVSEVMQGVESSLTELTTVLHDLGKGHETRSDQTNGAIQSVGRLVNDRLDENQGHLQQNAHEITDKIAARLDKLQNMSANQFQVIIDYLRQLETQGSSTSEPNSTNLADGQPLRRDEQAQTSAASHGGSKLSASINRLCLLASSKTQVCYLEDAEGIIDDLECILDAILHHEVQTTDKGLEGRKRKRSNEDQPQSIYRDIKRMRVAQKIKYLLSYSLNVGTRDSDGQGCLHTLLHLNRRTILERGAITHAHPTLFGVISLLIQTDADIYAVDDEGFSVTEFAHFNRMGHVWERALTRCGYDIQQVYNTDHNKGHEYSDDIYAPDHDQPRQVRAFCSNYYKAEGVEGLSGSDTPEPEKKIEWSYVNSMSEDEDAEEEEGKLDDDGKENDDNEKGQEEGTSHTTENYGQNSIEEHTETDTEQSLSDDEMGGVRVTG